MSSVTESPNSLTHVKVDVMLFWGKSSQCSTLLSALMDSREVENRGLCVLLQLSPKPRTIHTLMGNTIGCYQSPKISDRSMLKCAVSVGYPWLSKQNSVIDWTSKRLIKGGLYSTICSALNVSADATTTKISKSEKIKLNSTGWVCLLIIIARAE